MKKDVLGIKIDDINIDQATETVKGWLSSSVKRYIVTPNPEIVVMAQKDETLKKIINNADLAIPDGNGLKMSKLFSSKIGSDIVCNTPGIDLMGELIKLASDNGFTVGFLGGMDGVAKKTAERLLKKYPKLKVVFAESGGEVDKDGEEIELRSKNYESWKKRKNHNSLFMIPDSDLLFVAFGPPKQEKWISNNLSKIPVKVAMGVGGSLDILSGQVTRAPNVIRALGCEWLFRLIIQPWRIKRQLSLLKYIWLLTKERFGMLS